ncbi:MAG TPA: HAD-IC family P-type ATPase, partial [Bellilinea sp.]|nr:HAD-IC family P-type ATPase [Bellilinea sp.]
KRGILIKGGAFIEALASVDTVAFDKTGTLTKGQPELAHIATSDCAHGLESNCEDCDDMLAVAASLESQSTHPLAHAVVDAAKKRAVHNMYPPAEELRVIEGKGLAGKVNGIPTLVGSHRYFEESHPHSEELCQQVSSAEESGETTMLVATEDKVRGFLSVIDAEREESRDVRAQRRRMGKRTVLLTGDNAATASNIARSLGVAEVKSELLPQDKVTAVRELMSGGHKVAMIGDGINDAPALAASTVGIAVGGKASAQAMDTADIVLMSEGLKSLPLLFKLSNFAKRLIIQNITIALGVKLIFIVLALMGYTSMWMAVLADSGLSLLVTANGMRPLAVKD